LAFPPLGFFLSLGFFRPLNQANICGKKQSNGRVQQQTIHGPQQHIGSQPGHAQAPQQPPV